MLRFFIAVLFYIGASASAVSAGLVSKFVPDTDKKLPFSAHAARNLKKAAIHTATSTAANGGKVARNALSAVTGAMVDAGAASIAQEIGRAYRNGAGDMSWLTHKVCHFVLGGGSAALRGEDPLSGAIGATIGEVVADAMIARALEQTRADVLEQLEDFRANYGTLPPVQDAEALVRLTYLEHLEAEQADQIQRIGRLAAAGTAFVGRMDISAADAAADLHLLHGGLRLCQV